MVQDRDVHDLLNTGTWTTHRAKSFRESSPVKANQSSKLEPRGPKAPRSFTFPSHCPFPPPPSVEDEDAATAKEWCGSFISLSDEEPKCRGTVDQLPIILPVHEHNPERRFVLVTLSETDASNVSEAPQGQTTKPPIKTGYAANTKIQLDPKVDNDDKPPLQKRKSRADLPQIETDLQRPAQPRPVSYVHRTKSAACVDHQPENGADYFSPRPESARPAADVFLSPIIKHSTKGRDRAYWNFNSGMNALSPRDSTSSFKSSSGDRKPVDGSARTSFSATPANPRRLHSDMEVPAPKETRRTVHRHSSHKDEIYSRARNDVAAPSSDRRRSPSRLRRRDSSPVRAHPEREKLNRKRSSYCNRSPPPKEKNAELSSAEYDRIRSPRSHRERRKSTVVQEDRPSLLNPSGPRAVASSTSRSRPPSPLPSPKPSHTRLPYPEPQKIEPRSSTTFNHTRERRHNEQRPMSPISPDGSTSPKNRSLRLDDGAPDLGRPRAPSRTPSIRSLASNSKSVNVPPPIAAETHADDTTRRNIPQSPAYSRQGSFDTVPHSSSHWRPEPFIPLQQSTAPAVTPRQSGPDLEQPGPSVVSYRRYSEDVDSGALPGFPECQRQRPRAGYTDWLTLPRCDNFNICPRCYEHTFYSTEFRSHFVPAPIRSRDKEIACDLGSSPWYRIAWLMTRKYKRKDLRLLQGINDVFSRHRIACFGSARITRIWCSIIDPATRRCIPNFTICSPCAEAIQVLFPSLTGIFVPVDRLAESRLGTCSLYFSPNRNRFLKYFDAFENTHDQAVANQSPPNIQRLAENISMWSVIIECPQEEPVRQQSWYTMAQIPGMTVCEECFMDVVYPELLVDAEATVNARMSDSEANNSVASNFYQKPQVIRSATACRMASPWMRQLFRRACQREDGIGYLDSKVREQMRAPDGVG